MSLLDLLDLKINYIINLNYKLFTSTLFFNLLL